MRSYSKCLRGTRIGLIVLVFLCGEKIKELNQCRGGRGGEGKRLMPSERLQEG